MSGVNVAAIREALSEASPGPWLGSNWSQIVDDAEGERVANVIFEPDVELIVLLRNNAEALLDALERVKAASEGVDMLVAQAERRARGCPTKCDPDCAYVCHEAHEVSFKRDHYWKDCRGTQLAEAELRGTTKALLAIGRRWDEGGAVDPSAQWVKAWADAIGSAEL